ncbi:MAG: diguanylate cyclase [Scytolyngbya sp. HA4215-MV1]|jgi:diguanylate cyclase|nr:diguanylate cyclase [Scytolyngbya sp. HA4215-MV1]
MIPPNQPSKSIPEENNDDFIILLDEPLDLSDEAATLPSDLLANAWKIIIVDDEPDVHRATQLALKNLHFEGKPLMFFSAYSAEAGKQLITVEHPDAALILLDVVMETNDAGLKVIQYIREELKNQQVRIILRTGHPGEAPEEAVILTYDINDYKLKVELTRQKLLTSVISALRSYRDIITIDQQRLELAHALVQLRQTQLQLEEYTHTLEKKVAERTSDLAAANRELYRLVALDSLTLIANRRHFDEYWQQQWQLLTQQRHPLSLLLIDVDHFKFYNDYYGHQAGDECLRAVAQGIQRVLNRPTDLVARYGGEEFVVVLPYTSLKGATKLADAIMTEIYRLNLVHLKSPVSDRITLSMGIFCVTPQASMTSDAPIAQADKALYQAKQAGRNRYFICDLIDIICPSQWS